MQPRREGYYNAIQIYPWSEGALYQVYAAVGRVTVIALQPGEELVTVAAGDTVRWIVGDTSSGSSDAPIRNSSIARAASERRGSAWSRRCRDARLNYIAAAACFEIDAKPRVTIRGTSHPGAAPGSVRPKQTSRRVDPTRTLFATRPRITGRSKRAAFASPALSSPSCMPDHHDHVAFGIACAMLAGGCIEHELRARTREACGSHAAWIDELAAEVADTCAMTWPFLRAHDLARRIAELPAYRRGWRGDRKPRIAHWILRPERKLIAPMALDGVDLPDLGSIGDLAAWLGIDTATLDLTAGQLYYVAVAGFLLLKALVLVAILLTSLIGLANPYLLKLLAMADRIRRLGVWAALVGKAVDDALRLAPLLQQFDVVVPSFRHLGMLGQVAFGQLLDDISLPGQTSVQDGNLRG